MEIKVSIKQRVGQAFAEGIYSENGFIVKAGGCISKDFAAHIQGGASAKKYRDDKEFVDRNGKILKDCAFKSPSTAAMFVTGRSTNGYVAWKIEDGKKSLGEYLKEKGIR